MKTMKELFEQHIKNLNLSRTDEFIIESIKLSYFSGWADAMNNMTETWFTPTADQCKATLTAAVERLQEIEKEQLMVDEESLNLADPDPVSMDYGKISMS